MRKALVIGAARSGCAISRWLNHRGYEVYLTDTKAIPEKDELTALGIKVYEGGHPEALKQLRYDRIVKNPGIPYDAPFVAYFVGQGYHMDTELDIALNDCPSHPYAAVTGTNGKTTTTTLLGLLLQAKDSRAVAVGNIGLPAADALVGVERQDSPLAIEVSAFQLVACEHFKPHVAAIINLTPDHLNWFGTLEAYYKAKTLVYRLQDKEDFFLRNIDDPNVMRYVCDVPATVIDFSLSDPNVPLHVKEGAVAYRDIELFKVNDLHLVGPHNLQDAMIAAGMAYLMGVSPHDISRVISGFKGVEHRIEFTAEVDGVRYYNDSKATTPDATVVALKAFDAPVHLLVGGFDKQLPLECLVPYLGHVKAMYAFGQTKMQFKAIYPQVQIFDDMAQALQAARQAARPGEVVLLSPTCASWDQFPNFEVRGQEFKSMVHQFAGH